jgi:hypothetical protein
MTISQYGYVIQLCIELFGFIGFCKSENWKWTWNGCWWNPQKDGFQQQHVRSWTSKNDDFTLFSRQKKMCWIWIQKVSSWPQRDSQTLQPLRALGSGPWTGGPYPAETTSSRGWPSSSTNGQALPPAPPSQFRNGATVLTQISGRSRWRVPKFIQFILASGNLLHSYRKWPFIVDFPIKNGDFPLQC